MAVNRDKPDQWKKDILLSVDMYNEWFMNFAPQAFRETRIKTTKQVEEALKITDGLRNISPQVLKENPKILSTLRMSTCPPIAVDRLIGLAKIDGNLVHCMEGKCILPLRMSEQKIDEELSKISRIIQKMADPDIFIWLDQRKTPSRGEIRRAATIVADRLCGAVANPIIRNAQEKRQLSKITAWLKNRDYTPIASGQKITFNKMPAGTFGFHMNVPVKQEGRQKPINIPMDVIIMRRKESQDNHPLFIEAKSAGDFTNVNKRRKEEATKMAQLRSTYGEKTSFNLFLCGYFDSGYLGYEAAEGIDWVWEHRIDDLAKFRL